MEEVVTKNTSSLLRLHILTEGCSAPMDGPMPNYNKRVKSEATNEISPPENYPEATA